MVASADTPLMTRARMRSPSRNFPAMSSAGPRRSQTRSRSCCLTCTSRQFCSRAVAGESRVATISPRTEAVSGVSPARAGSAIPRETATIQVCLMMFRSRPVRGPSSATADGSKGNTRATGNGPNHRSGASINREKRPHRGTDSTILAGTEGVEVGAATSRLSEARAGRVCIGACVR